MSEHELAAFLRSHQVGDYVYTGTMFDEKLRELLLRGADGQPDWEANFRAALRTIEGLRALEGLLARLDQWTPTLLEIARAVARTEGRHEHFGHERCLFCEAETGVIMTGLEDVTIAHTADCPVTKARALLAEEHPA